MGKDAIKGIEKPIELSGAAEVCSAQESSKIMIPRNQLHPIDTQYHPQRAELVEREICEEGEKYATCYNGVYYKRHPRLTILNPERCGYDLISIEVFPCDLPTWDAYYELAPEDSGEEPVLRNLCSKEHPYAVESLSLEGRYFAGVPAEDEWPKEALLSRLTKRVTPAETKFSECHKKYYGKWVLMSDELRIPFHSSDHIHVRRMMFQKFLPKHVAAIELSKFDNNNYELSVVVGTFSSTGDIKRSTQQNRKVGYWASFAYKVGIRGLCDIVKKLPCSQNKEKNLLVLQGTAKEIMENLPSVFWIVKQIEGEDVCVSLRDEIECRLREDILPESNLTMWEPEKHLKIWRLVDDSWEDGANHGYRYRRFGNYSSRPRHLAVFEIWKAGDDSYIVTVVAGIFFSDLIKSSAVHNKELLRCINEVGITGDCRDVKIVLPNPQRTEGNRFQLIGGPVAIKAILPRVFEIIKRVEGIAVEATLCQEIIDSVTVPVVAELLKSAPHPAQQVSLSFFGAAASTPRDPLPAAAAAAATGGV